MSRTDNTRLNLFDLRRRHPLPHGAWVGLASPVVRGEEDRELTFEVGDGATGSGTTTGALPVVSRQRHRGRWHRWCSVEGGGGAEGGKLG
jgi:hypothetical protein